MVNQEKVIFAQDLRILKDITYIIIIMSSNIKNKIKDSVRKSYILSINQSVHAKMPVLLHRSLT